MAAQERRDLREALHPGGEGKGNPLRVLAWRIPWMEEAGRHTVHGVAQSWTPLN